MPTSLGPAEILVILIVALIVLGPKRLPEAGRQVGKAIAEVRKWSQGFQDEIRSTIDPDASRPSYTQPQPGYSPPPIPMVPAETPAPAQDVTDVPATETAPPAGTNGAAVSTGSHGVISEPLPADWTPTGPATTDPAGPSADDPPRT